MIGATCVLVSSCRLTIGRAQPVSYHRYSTFAVPITILAGVALWHTVTLNCPDTGIFRLQTHWTPLAVVGLCLLVLVNDTRLYRHLDVQRTRLVCQRILEYR